MREHSLFRIIRVTSMLVAVAAVGVSPILAQGYKSHGTAPVGPRPLEKSDKAEKAAVQGDRTDGGDVIRVRKFAGVGRQIQEKTPEYKTSAPRGVKSAGDWAQITLTYDTAPDWIDELTFQFYVMVMKTDGGKKTYSFFKTTVKCVDIEKGREHLCSVYLRPNTLKRYGAVVSAAVEVSYEGHVIAEKAESDIPMPEKWWTKAEIVDNKDVTARDGYLLDRSQTPFVFVNIDDYEVSK